MLRPMRPLALLALLALVACTAACDSTEQRGPDWELVTRHAWVDHLPKSETEMIHALVLIDQDRGRIGVAAHASQWRAEVDAFQWSKTASGADVRFPQTGKRASWTLRGWRCKDAPPPFELCLVVATDGRHRRYYSKRDWIITDAASPDEALAAIRAAID